MTTIDRNVAIVLSDGSVVGPGNGLPTTGGGGGGGGAVTMAAGAVAAGAYVVGSLLDGAIVTLGANADAAVTGDNPGTVNAHLRGLTKIAGDVWDSTGHRLHVDASGTTGTVSTANSTSTTLAGNAAFTGTSEDVSNYAAITVTVLADQASATAGLQFEFSSDGTHWDYIITQTVAASVAASFTLTPHARFFRIVYTNGAALQGAFRLQTVYHQEAVSRSGAAFVDVNGTMSPAGIMQRVAADLMVQSAGANLTNRVRCAADMVGGVGGGSHLGQGIGIYNPGQAKFFPVIGNADGSLAVGGYSTAVTVTLTRPANVTAYSAQDEVGTSGTSPVSIAISRITGGTGIITGARLTYASNPTTTPSFRLLLFNASVTLAGDNSPLALSSADGKKFIGLIDFTVTQAGGTATSAPVMAGGVPVAPIPFMTDTIFGALITLNGFTPISSSEQIQISVDAEQN